MRIFPAILTSVFVIKTMAVLCQEPPVQREKFIIGSGAFYGFIAGYDYKMAHLIKGHVPGAELVFRWQATGKKNWEKLFRFPEKGIGVLYLDLANPQQLGKGAGVFGFINYPIFRTQLFSLHYRLGAGAGYLSRIFDPTFNYKNNAAGSHFNVLFNFLIEWRFLVSHRINFSAGTGFTHFSNGAIKMPNLGINIPSLVFILAWNGNRHTGVSSADSLQTHRDDFNYSGKLYRSVVISGGMRDLYPPGGYRFKGIGCSMDYGFIFRNKRALTAGSDFFYDEYISYLGIVDTVHFRGKIISPVRAGIHISHLSLMGRFQTGVQLGFYLFDRYKLNGLFYHRLIIRYRIPQNILLNLAIKTHWAKAEYLEWGIGYAF